MRSPRLRMSPHMARAEGQAPGSIPDRIVRPRPRTTVLLPPHLVSPSIGRRRGRDRGPAATHRSGQGSALDPSGFHPEPRPLFYKKAGQKILGAKHTLRSWEKYVAGYWGKWYNGDRNSHPHWNALSRRGGETPWTRTLTLNLTASCRNSSE